MPTRTGRPDPTEVELASRLSALGLPAPAVIHQPVTDSPKGWCPEQPSAVPAPATAPPMGSLLWAWVGEANGETGVDRDRRP